VALTHVPDAGSISAAGRPPECTQKYWPCKSNSVRLGSLPRELTARRLPSGCRPGFWPQGQWELLYSFASKVGGASRSASTSSRAAFSSTAFLRRLTQLCQAAQPAPRDAVSHARRALRAKRRRPPCGGAGPHRSAGYTGPQQSSPGARDDDSVLVMDAGSTLVPGSLSEARRRLKTASAGPGAQFCRLLVVRERLPALGSHERVVVTAH
jgi:hypothetical protein